MSEIDFEHHVTAEKNDFSTWVHEIIQDYHLAKLMKQTKTREDFLDVLRNQLEQHSSSTGQVEFSSEEDQETFDQEQETGEMQELHGNKSANKSTKIAYPSELPEATDAKNSSRRSTGELDEKPGKKFHADALDSLHLSRELPSVASAECSTTSVAMDMGTGMAHDIAENMIVHSSYLHEMTPDEVTRALRKEFLYGMVLGIIIGLLLSTALL